MTIEIDQSGKIEHSQVATVIAFTNGKQKSVKINSPDKQMLIKIAREMDFPKQIYIFKIFTAMIFILVKDENIFEIKIDEEYPGQGPVIKNILLNLYAKSKIKPPSIKFVLVGKESKAHIKAIETWRGNQKAEIIIEAKQVLDLVYPNWSMARNKKSRRSRKG
ncbi:MAG: hypothetical protein Q7S14_00585 [bacterium]|nr:hypothetical protein [bacterium]